MNPSRNEVPPILGNPFFHRSPIQDRRYFYGRVEETRRAMGMLRNSQCVSIVGPRRIGKTSLLFHLCDPRVQQEYHLGEKFLFVFIDCQGLGDLDKAQLYQWLQQEVERTFAEREETDATDQEVALVSVQEAQKREFVTRTRLRETLATRFNEDELRTLCFDLGIDYDDLPGDGKAGKARELVAYVERYGHIHELLRTVERMRPDIAWIESISEFGEFRQAIRQLQKKGYKPVLLFDEFDIIALNSKLDRNFFSKLRSLVPGVIHVTASHDSLRNLTYADRSVLSSPFFNVFVPVDLGFLKPEEAREMVSGLLKMTGQESLFTEEDLASVFEVAGYHPFFLQLACYYLFEEKREHTGLEETDHATVRQRYAEDTEAHFDYIWKNLDPNEQETVRLVREGKVSQLTDEQRRQLERKCILHDNAIFSSVFAEFVRR